MIVSRQNQKIKDIRRLRRCKGDRAILEGPHLVEEALEAGMELETVLASAEFLGTQEGRNLLGDTSSPVTEVASHLIDYLCDADSPRGVLAVVSLPRDPVSSLPVQDEGLYLFVDGVQDPGNLGALARVAEAFSVTALVLAPGSAHPNHPRSLRASAGSLLRTEVVIGASATDLSDRLAPVSPVWLALTPRGGRSITDVKIDGTLILAVGAEGPGLSEETLALASIHVSIPLAGQVESLNSTVAAAIVLHAMGVPGSRP